MRARGEGRIFKRGNVYWIQFYSYGAQVRESAETDDEKKAARVLRKRLGEVGAGIEREVRGLRYEDLRESYFADYATNTRKSLRTNKKGEPYLDKVNRLDSYFAGFRSSDIGPEDVRKFIADQQKKGLASGTINRSLAALKRMFRIALRDGRLRTVPYIPMLKEAAPRSGFFERSEFESLYKALPSYLRLPLALGYYTGMRRAEICGLKWGWPDRGFLYQVK
jgi:integrase